MDSDFDLYQYSKAMSEAKLTLWHELPDYGLYSEQFLQIVKEELAFLQIDAKKLITKSMVNNYVKWDMIPKPEKKKYEKIHIACVIVITILKQLLPITKIKEGILLQIRCQGTERAYDAFCEALEESMKRVFVPILNEQIQYVFEKRKIGYDKLAVSTITTALASKLLTEKIIETKMKQHESNKGAENK
jgi:hypothetical protein